MLQALIFVTLPLSLIYGGAYLYSAWQLYQIVKVEKPEWIKKTGHLSVGYGEVPRFGDANVSLVLLRVAFGSRVQDLQSPLAFVIARRIRILLVVNVVLLSIMFVGFLGRP